MRYLALFMYELINTVKSFSPSFHVFSLYEILNAVLDVKNVLLAAASVFLAMCTLYISIKMV